jgi:hypothetical protein
MTSIKAVEAAELYADGEGVDGDTAGGWTLVGQAQEHEERQARWHQRYWLIVRDDASDTWGLSYGLGLTEYQEHDLPWEHVPAYRELALTRLYPHVRMTTSYRTKPAEVTA